MPKVRFHGTRTIWLGIGYWRIHGKLWIDVYFPLGYLTYRGR